jgi:coenzyme PQQ precursor peptide PqqA
LNPLIRLWFDLEPHNHVRFLLRCSINPQLSIAKNFTGEVFNPDYFNPARAEFVLFTRRAKMAWKTPKIVEVPVGMEINMYACAARK